MNRLLLVTYDLFRKKNVKGYKKSKNGFQKKLRQHITHVRNFGSMESEKGKVLNTHEMLSIVAQNFPDLLFESNKSNSTTNL